MFVTSANPSLLHLHLPQKTPTGLLSVSALLFWVTVHIKHSRTLFTCCAAEKDPAGRGGLVLSDYRNCDISHIHPFARLEGFDQRLGRAQKDGEQLISTLLFSRSIYLESCYLPSLYPVKQPL